MYALVFPLALNQSIHSGLHTILFFTSIPICSTPFPLLYAATAGLSLCLLFYASAFGNLIASLDWYICPSMLLHVICRYVCVYNLFVWMYVALISIIIIIDWPFWLTPVALPNFLTCNYCDSEQQMTKTGKNIAGISYRYLSYFACYAFVLHMARFCFFLNFFPCLPCCSYASLLLLFLSVIEFSVWNVFAILSSFLCLSVVGKSQWNCI